MLRGRTPLSVASTLIRGQSSLSRPAPSATMSTAAEQAGAEEVLLQRRGAAVVVTLNRPKALNALNTAMVQRMLPLYREWSATTSDPQLVILKGAGDKAFCAGGDVRGVVELQHRGSYEAAADFFATEYRLNYALATLPKPHVALIGGVTMGGGVGVSVHGAFRVATERTLFAMPELAIGLFPDVGGSYFLPRLPGELGMYLALTGARLKGIQAKEAGIATHYVPSAALPAVEEALSQLGEAAADHCRVDAELRRFEDTSTPPSGLMESLPAINEAFGRDSLLEVVASLEQQAGQGSGLAREALDALRRGSPFSAHVAFEQVRRGRRMSVAECLEMEHGMANYFVREATDFAEGVRAVLVEKDNAPRWMHRSLSEVTAAEVARVFEPLPEASRLGLCAPSPKAAL
mmetsp:Transcript_16955/g.43470  ORF Transcript_16955/g.43470 Transcript_16955/m.43470 type:complete len:405 (+) Transcript_16955:303-1517(+)